MKNKDSVSGLAPVNQLFKLPGLWSPGDQDAEATSVAYQLHDLGWALRLSVPRFLHL